MTVSIGIPAYNEEDNIKPLLQSILAQQIHNARLEKILVISDGSTDGTVVKAKEFQNPLVEVLGHDIRLGQQARQNEILDRLDSDIIVIIEADTRPVSANSIDNLLEPFLHDSGTAATVGESLTVMPSNFFEKVLFHGEMVKERIFKAWQSGENVYRIGGHGARAISKNLAQILRWPEDVPEDSYLYLFLKSRNLRLVKCSNSEFYAKHVDNLWDRYKQCLKYVTGKKSLERYLGVDTLRHEFELPRLLVMKHVLLYFIKHPFWTLLALAEMGLNRILTFGRSSFNPLYQPYLSSKKLSTDLYDKQSVNVSIGVATYNAEGNIEHLINVLTNQQQDNNTVEKIIVYSDASSDKTVELAKKFSDPRLIVVDSHQRGGFAQAMQNILKMSDSDLTVVLNDDIKIFDQNFISKYVKAFQQNRTRGLITANPQPLQPENFTEKMAYTGFKIYEKLRYRNKDGNNILSCDGKTLALSREFIEKLRFPQDASTMGNVDSFLYYSCLANGFKYGHTKEAVVYFKLPATISDYLKWMIRNNSDRKVLKKQFGSLVDIESRDSKRMFSYFVFRELIIHPIRVLSLVVLGLYIRMINIISREEFNQVWEVVSTTKWT